MTLQSRCSHKVQQVANANTTRLTSQLTTKSIWHVESVTQDKPYQVKLEWTKEDSQIVIKTQLVSHSHKDNNPHPVNLSQTVSYHILGVIKKMANEKGKEIHFANTEANAKKRGGDVIRIDNMGNGSVWASYRDVIITFVVKNESSIPRYKSRLEYNRELMRGPVEEGIE